MDGFSVFLALFGLFSLALCRYLIERGMTQIYSGPPRRHALYAAAEGFALAVPLLVFAVSAAAAGNHSAALTSVGGGTSFLFLFQFAPYAAWLPGIVLKRDFLDKGIPLLAASALLAVFVAGGHLTSAEGAILLVLPMISLLFSAPSEAPPRKPPPIGAELVMKRLPETRPLFLGVIFLPIGAFFIYRYFAPAAEFLSLSQTGAGLLASFLILLPDAFSAWRELRKKERSLRCDRLLYSALFTVTIIPGTLAHLSSRFAVPGDSALFTAAGLLFPSIVAVLPPLFTERITRFQGVCIGIFSLALLAISFLL
ncbi:hypothetical protein LJC34_04975 [Oscillospiraceae bacterium OttesenSCG-928-G22]|nr:hypothetical protein [Oscillospiraceae bacterium OttesenSCG-928-G22]